MDDKFYVTEEGLDELKKQLIAQNKQYSQKEYNAYKRQFNKQIREKRNQLLEEMKKERETLKKLKKEEREKRKKEDEDSVIKEQRKLRRQAKSAKQLTKFTDVIKAELKNVENEFNYRCNSIKSDWNNMMSRYEKAIKEIKSFFQNGGDGYMFIDYICDRINQDCDDIKDLCKNLTVQLTSSVVKVAIPADLPAFPNPIYKIADLWTDIKIIIKFIKDLIELVIDIINCINKLARIMLNGLNSLKDIINQLMELLGIKWFMDLIQNIIDFFGSKITDVRELLENMLSPVYYSDTDEYESTLEYIESLIDDNGNSIKSLSGLDDKNRYYQISNMSINELSQTDNDGINGYEKLMDELDSKGEDIVAYKSPIIDPSPDLSSVSEVVNGDKSFDADIKFIGWHFFHTSVRNENKYKYTGLFGEFINKIKNKIIGKASKTSNKKRGGIKGLKERWRVKGISSYEAFYWYTYYTLDLEKDCFVGMNAEQNHIYIDSVIQQENGAIVSINDNGVTRKVFVADNMVRKGDYVNVDGIKYRVQ